MTVLIKNSHIGKKELLRQLKPIYMFYISKFMNNQIISELEEKRVKEFIKAGFKNWVGCEINQDYVDIANARITYWTTQNEQLNLFGDD